MESHFFLEKIQRLKGKISKRYQTLINFIQNHPKEIAFMTLSDLSKATGISESSIVRFSTTLGYRGYSAFKKDFQQKVRAELTSLERFKLSPNGRQHWKKISHPFQNTLQNERENLQKLLGSIRDVELNQIIHALETAQTIFVAGAQSTESMAQYFGYHLSIISDNVRTITHANGDTVNLLKEINEKSLLFLISLVRYPRILVNIGHWAKQKEAKVVVITDNVLSPFKDMGDILLIVPTNFTSFLYTNAALIALLNCIIVEFSSKRKTQVIEHLKRWDESNAFHSIFV